MAISWARRGNELEKMTYIEREKGGKKVTNRYGSKIVIKKTNVMGNT